MSMRLTSPSRRTAISSLFAGQLDALFRPLERGLQLLALDAC
jgi:hypothetical protein